MVARCTVQGCPGEYEERTVVHTVRHRGQLVVIENVPAEVCAVCGDVLLTPDTVRRIEALPQSRPEPVGPYRYTSTLSWDTRHNPRVELCWLPGSAFLNSQPT
jgi:YgiT-type zinc finger domain-containing protein